jgi:hypothetical protein
MKHYKAVKIAAGHYAVNTPDGTYQLYRYHPHSSGRWAITNPGDTEPSDIAFSKAEALEMIAWEVYENHDPESPAVSDRG